MISKVGGWVARIVEAVDVCEAGGGRGGEVTWDYEEGRLAGTRGATGPPEQPPSPELK